MLLRFWEARFWMAEGRKRTFPGAVGAVLRPPGEGNGVAKRSVARGKAAFSEVWRRSGLRSVKGRPGAGVMLRGALCGKDVPVLNIRRLAERGVFFVSSEKGGVSARGVF